MTRSDEILTVLRGGPRAGPAAYGKIDKVKHTARQDALEGEAMILAARARPPAQARLESSARAIAHDSRARMVRAVAAAGMPCAVPDANLCDTLLGASSHAAQDHERAPARRTIYFAGEPCNDLCAICAGWAITFLQLPDGRRQILSVLLPGDLFSAAALFEERLHFSVHTLTEVSYWRYRRSDLKSRLAREPDLLDRVARQLSSEKRQADMLAADLGRRTAEQRIAGLILRLVERLEQGGVDCGAAFLFPLRQQHIADITGLTPVHVNRTFAAFRREGIVMPARGLLWLTDRARLRRIAGSR
jgi:CRP/FNR family transcriptional regulator, anaerobic regulatory protein